MARVYTSALDVIQKRQDRSRASNFIQHAESHANPGDEVLVVCRESPTNNKKEDLRRLQVQERDSNQFAGERRLVVLGTLSRICWGDDPRWLLDVAARAAELGPRVKLLFQRPSRILRASEFHPQKRPDELPTDQEWEDAMACLGYRVVMTILRPDATNAEDAAYRSKVGQRASNDHGGGDRMAGHKKRRRDERTPLALKLYDYCQSINQVAYELKLPRSTVWRWVHSRD